MSSPTALRPTPATTAVDPTTAPSTPAAGGRGGAPTAGAEVVELGPHRRDRHVDHRRGDGTPVDATGASPPPLARATPETRAARMAAMLVVAHGEVAAGLRPFDQLRSLLAPTLVRRLAVQLRTAGPDPTALADVTHVLTAPPTPSGAIEATVVVRRGQRGGAVAVRLERHRGRWRATELTAPEAGHAPLTTRSRGDERDAFDEAADEDGQLRAPRGSA